MRRRRSKERDVVVTGDFNGRWRAVEESTIYVYAGVESNQVYTLLEKNVSTSCFFFSSFTFCEACFMRVYICTRGVSSEGKGWPSFRTSFRGWRTITTIVRYIILKIVYLRMSYVLGWVPRRYIISS